MRISQRTPWIARRGAWLVLVAGTLVATVTPARAVVDCFWVCSATYSDCLISAQQNYDACLGECRRRFPRNQNAYNVCAQGCSALFLDDHTRCGQELIGCDRCCREDIRY